MRSTGRLLLCVTVLVTLAVTAASAAPDRTVTLKPGETVTYQATSQAGLNPLYFDQGQGLTPVPVGGSATCTKDPNTFCDTYLVTFENPVPEADADGKLRKNATFIVDPAQPGVDYDLLVFAVKPDGSKGAEVGRSTAFPQDNEGTETATVSVETTRAAPSTQLLAEIIYFTGVGGFTSTVRF